MSGTRATAALLLAAATLTVAGCADDVLAPAEPQQQLAGVEEHSQVSYSADTSPRAIRRWLRRVRRATRPFRDYAVAEEEGYDVQATPCQETDAGGMGYHFANFGLLDGTLEETRPEILLYEPRRNGRQRLVAVEYAIPYAEAPRDGDPPQLHGVEFGRNDVFDLWVLHAWVFKWNPEGTFEGWNPRVSCKFDI